jgi:hypothetical protein
MDNKDCINVKRCEICGREYGKRYAETWNDFYSRIRCGSRQCFLIGNRLTEKIRKVKGYENNIT